MRAMGSIGCLLLALWPVAGCGNDAATEPPPAEPELLRAAVLISAAEAPAQADVQRVFNRAAAILASKTAQGMTLTEVVRVGTGQPSMVAAAYVNGQAASPPDGVIVLSDDAMATAYGGYSVVVALPPSHRNAFPSPIVGDTKAYVAVVDFVHKYARCGYDDAGNRVSTTSLGGECRNQSGSPCVHNGKYWMCPNSQNDMYADLDYFTACTIVHELMHPFGPAGNLDHYGAAQCTARTGMSAADAQDLRLFQQSCGMCPDVFGAFRGH